YWHGFYCKIILLDENSTTHDLLNYRGVKPFVNHQLCHYLLKKLSLEDLMTPKQFLVYLCKIAFCHTIYMNFEAILQYVETPDNIGDYSIQTFQIQRSSFEVKTGISFVQLFRKNFYHSF